MIRGSGQGGLWVALLAATLLAGAAQAEPDSDEAAADQQGAFIPPEVHVCLGCHTVDEADRRGAQAAPPLWGIVGRAPKVDGVEVARWDAHSLDRWLANPRAMAPETASRFPGYADAATREAVIRFLKRQQ
jgi:cytochrome c